MACTTRGNGRGPSPWGAIALSLALCAPAPSSGDRTPVDLSRARADAPGRTVVVITLDGVRPREVFSGADSELARSRSVATPPAPTMPFVRRHLDRGGLALGAPGSGSSFSVAGPTYVSLPGYAQLFLGRDDVACATNDCAPAEIETLVDSVARTYGRRSAVVLSSWPAIERVALSHPELALGSYGRRAGDGREQVPGYVDATGDDDAYPGHGDYRPDEGTAELGLRVLTELRPALLFVGLGDADELAHRGEYAGYLNALQRADRWLERFARRASELAEAGHPVSIFVTTDHGRGSGFDEHAGHAESAETWLLAMGSSLRGGASERPQPRRLSDLAPTVAALLSVPLPEATGQVMSELLDAR